MTAAPDLIPAAHLHLGVDCQIDPGVLLGYLSGRPVPHELTIGPSARMRSGTVVYAGSTIGGGLQTGHHVVIREQCRIGGNVAIWSNSVVDYGCTLGDEVKIHTSCYVSQFTVIGDGAFLAPGVTLANDLYPGDDASADAMRGPTIGAGAQLGVNVTVLPYVRIGAGAMIGAGAVVTRDIPEGMLAYGNPAVPVRPVASLPDIRTRVPDVAERSGRLGYS